MKTSGNRDRQEQQRPGRQRCGERQHPSSVGMSALCAPCAHAAPGWTRLGLRALRVAQSGAVGSQESRFGPENLPNGARLYLPRGNLAPPDVPRTQGRRSHTSSSVPRAPYPPAHLVSGGGQGPPRAELGACTLEDPNQQSGGYLRMSVVPVVPYYKGAAVTPDTTPPPSTLAPSTCFGQKLAGAVAHNRKALPSPLPSLLPLHPLHHLSLRS